jgi:cytochrome c oxidase assembly protein subunit 15
MIPQFRNIKRNINKDYVLTWEVSTIVVLFALIVIGGITRLTESGLSITEWSPVMGIFFPFSENSWNKEFDKYKLIPEFILMNPDMTLHQFKVIYFWEWFHRFIARVLGLVFFVPYIYFIYKKKLSRIEIKFLPIILLMGVIQAFVGWYMVKSGLSENVNVSQYRLAMHLSIAFLILGALFLLVQYRYQKSIEIGISIPRNYKISSNLLVGFIFLQIIFGAFMSGIRAGRSYNTWPLLDGEIVPDGLFAMPTWYLNFFENILTIHFDHRMLAYLIILLVFIQLKWMRQVSSNTIYQSTMYLFTFICVQILIGIFAVLYQVPIYMGVMHQIGAVLVYLSALRQFFLLNLCDVKLSQVPV